MSPTAPPSAPTCPACRTPDCHETTAISGHPLHVCPQCTLWFHNPASLTETPDYNDVYKTAEYAETHLKTLGEVQDWQAFARYDTYRPFFAALQPAVGSLLDVGCGVGRFCRAAYSAGWQVKGIDVSATAIGIGAVNLPFELVQRSIGEEVAAGQTYQVVTSFEVIEHLAQPLDFLAQVRQALQPGGTFFCTVPNQASPTVRTSTRKDWLPPIHLLFFNQRALHALLEQAGFTHIRVGEIVVHAPPAHPLKRLAYRLLRALGQLPPPDALGLWAMAQQDGQGDQGAPAEQAR